VCGSSLVARAAANRFIALLSITDMLKRDPLGEPIIFLFSSDVPQRFAGVRLGVEWVLWIEGRVIDELAHELLAECGGAAIPQVSALGRQMILGHSAAEESKQAEIFFEGGDVSKSGRAIGRRPQ